MNILNRGLFGAIFALSVGVPAFAQETMRIGFATVNDPLHEVTKAYAEELEARTDGRIRVEIFPAGQLGNIPNQIESIRIGAQAAFVSPAGFFSGLNPNFGVVDAPGIYRSPWHAHNAVTDPVFRDRYATLAEDEGIVGALLFNYGPTSIAATTPVSTLEEMRGLKIRVLASRIESELASLLGMTGVPMPFADVVPGIQQGTIDGVRTSLTAMASGRFYAAAPYVTQEETGMIIAGIWLSTRWLDRLPDDLREIVLETGRDLETRATEIAMEFDANSAVLWVENGGEVIDMSEEELGELRATLSSLGDDIIGADPETADLYAVLREVLESAPDVAPTE
ncbi:MAG TPA: TRAP transporter substrate-binding protein [Roseovarius sp.]|nr:TRAP transporter substrate-binding protein [Roseovarius sp.]